HPSLRTLSLHDALPIYPGVKAMYPASSNSVDQRSQLLGSSHRPWMNTTGVSPAAFARSSCCVSCSVIVVASLTLVAIAVPLPPEDRKCTRLNSSHEWMS